MPDFLESHLCLVVKAIQEGKLIPFLGAGVNLCGRPSGVDWDSHQHTFLPSGRELATHLAKESAYPQITRCGKCGEPLPQTPAIDLLRVAQFVVAMAGSGELYADLHGIFDADYPPTSVHRFLASLPAALRAKQLRVSYPLIVTTNYDDLMERALREAGQDYDVVTYVAEGEHRGLFLHWPPDPDRGPVLIERPNEYREVSTAVRPVVMKIHGSVDRRRRPDPAQEAEDSFVITEDHYIEYLTRTDLSGLVPVHLLERLRNSHFLFLGYGLADWNLRVILHRIAAGRAARKLKSWAIQVHPDALERKFWDKRDIDILDLPLDEYVGALRAELEGPHAPPPAIASQVHP